MAWHRREHGRLVAAVLHSRILYTDASLLNYAAHACWEATASTAVDFPDAWAAQFVADCRGLGGRHDHRQNASYGVVNLPVFFRVLAPRTL